MTRKMARLPIKKASELQGARSFLFYGRSGTGKTSLASTFPGPILLLDVMDEGTDSVVDVKDLDVMEITSLDDIEDAYWYLKNEKHKYKTVIIDTVSQLQMVCLEEIVGAGKKGKKAGDWGSMSQKQWGEVASYMKEWLINFRDLSKQNGIETVFLAQDRVFNANEEENGDGELTPEVGPGLSPSVAKTLAAAVSVVGNTFIRSREVVKEVNGKKVKRQKTEYCLRVGPNPVYTTKVRKPRGIPAPDYIVDPSYDAIIELIEGD